jgi:hypothetical protein
MRADQSDRCGARTSKLKPTRNEGYDMQGVKDASGLYEVERRAYHAARPGFRIAELQISPSQKVPWHYHTNVHDTLCES